MERKDPNLELFPLVALAMKLASSAPHPQERVVDQRQR